MSDEIMKAGFDHPCKQTCSGWKQGYERGQFDLQDAITEAHAVLHYYSLHPAGAKVEMSRRRFAIVKRLGDLLKEEGK